MDLKVGDIIYHRRLGIMLLTEDCVAKTNSPFQLLHGNPVFRMKKLISDMDYAWILYDNNIVDDTVRLATDEDIVKKLIYHINTFQIGEEISVSIDLEYSSLSLTDKENFINLNKVQIKELKNLLKGLNV